MKSYIRPLAIVFVSLFGFLIIVTLYADKSAFQLTAGELHQRALLTDYAVNMSMVNKMDNPLLIDIRDVHAYRTNHLPNAVNTPLKRILEPELLQVYKTKRKKVIISDDPMKAHEAWMLLTQMGIEELYVME